MKSGDRVELTMPLIDVCVGVRGNIIGDPELEGAGCKVKFDGYDMVRILVPNRWIRKLTVLDMIVEALD